ncbi:MAG: rubredoxin [bacterium]|nr:rubredoxin [bacterium]
MEKHICTVCQWIYNPEENNDIKFEDLPDDFICPMCGVGKEMFEKEN